MALEAPAVVLVGDGKPVKSKSWSRRREWTGDGMNNGRLDGHILEFLPPHKPTRVSIDFGHIVRSRV